jgi:hypothetical protein
VADHAVLIGIGDGPGFEPLHHRERRVHLRPQRREIGVGKPHAADIEREPEFAIREMVLAVTVPGGHQNLL